MTKNEPQKAESKKAKQLPLPHPKSFPNPSTPDNFSTNVFKTCELIETSVVN